MTCIPENMAVGLFPVMAQIHRAPNLYSKWNQPSNNGMTVTVVVLILLLSALAYVIARRLLIMLKKASPGTTLFDELAKAHSLNKIEKTALKRIARHEKLGGAAVLFVRRDYLETYAKSNAPIYKKLYEKLFLK